MPNPPAAAARPSEKIQEMCPVLSSWTIPRARPITAHVMVHCSIVSCNCRSFDFLMLSAPVFDVSSHKDRTLEPGSSVAGVRGRDSSLQPVDEQRDDQRVGEIDEEGTYQRYHQKGPGRRPEARHQRPHV